MATHPDPIVPGSLHVVLVRPEIPWNTGNAGRTCLAAGARLHLVGPLGFSLDDRDVRRAGLDYWPRVRPRIWNDWDAFAAGMDRLGEPFLFTAGALRTLWEISFPKRSVLVFGPESVGLPQEVRERYAERLVRIPMVDPALRSINLATSVGIALFEAARQREGAAGRESAESTSS
jgi:tRNA (cytidine/uridine-2'-O-)-methyltransferase